MLGIRLPGIIVELTGEIETSLIQETVFGRTCIKTSLSLRVATRYGRRKIQQLPRRPAEATYPWKYQGMGDKHTNISKTTGIHGGYTTKLGNGIKQSVLQLLSWLLLLSAAWFDSLCYRHRYQQDSPPLPAQ